MNGADTFRALKMILIAVFLTVACPRILHCAERHYRVPNTRLVFSLTASPVEAKVFLFSAGQEEAEELSSGTPAIVDLDTSKIVRFAKFETLQGDSNVVWSRDGKHAFFETTRGVFEVDVNRPLKTPKAIVMGTTHGIALSGRGSRLAFWKVGKVAWKLVVRDAKTSAILQSWTIPFVYGGEASGFELVFQDENTVYARTFDNQGGTPLKRFDVTTAKIETIERDCLALASGGTAAYYIANMGHRHTLKKVTAGGEIVTIASASGFDDLRASAGGRWIAIAGGDQSAVLDTASDQISTKSSCRVVTILADGTIVFVHNSTLSSDVAICESSK